MTPWLLLALLGAAAAQDPPPPAPDAPDEAAEEDEEDVDLVITVVSRVDVLAARDEVVRALKELGWRPRARRDGMVLFRGPESWMGKAKLYETGDLEFTTPVLAISGPRDAGGTYDPNRGFDNDAQSGTVGVSSTPLPSPKKVRAVQDEIRDAVQPLVLEYRAKIQAAHFSTMLGELPSRLDALWERGEPLVAMTPRATWEEKRADVLEYWATRLPSNEGLVVSKTVESWLRNTVMTSAHPVTPEEQAAAEARRTDGRRLDLGR